MPKRTYDSSLFQVNENGFLTYDSDKYTSKIGIDVSRYQAALIGRQSKTPGLNLLCCVWVTGDTAPAPL